ncbi:hypothetical protein TEA_005392 [Camellia sinensis var. sinensis]|uniref:peptidylprolyl isomerase n=1 Tax=Camellia sinensis var. sinensis TaxID=542762 RepID=A0A4S4DDJ1_CAMSN|nr:hypothetical protein TEA_005392 [Camellia sinensis var. sinensis]
MAFWGVEVKPGKPFTHSFDRIRGRLRISQATLGIGSSTKTSLVQCNVGDKSPVFLCALLPDKIESCHLELEFEEADEVVFSVIGPRSVYLTGYYLGNGRHSNLNDDTDSYGEDIANSETERSTHCSDEDEYEDSFIDDGNVEVFPASPISNDREVDEEMLDMKKPRRKSIRKRLKKNYQSIESDDDDDNNSHQKHIINECTGVSGLVSEDEDNFPISFLHKSSRTEAGEKIDMETSKTGNKKTEDDGTCIIDPKSKADAVVVDGEPERGIDLPSGSFLCSDGVGSENSFELKRERKERSSEGKTLKTVTVYCYNAHNEEKLQYTGEKTQKPDTDKESDLPYNSLPPSNEVGFENHMKSKKKRKERTKGKTLMSGVVNHSNSLKDHEVLQDKAEDQKPATEKETDWCLPSTEAGSENGAKPKKRRKECAADRKAVEGSANYNNVLKEDKMKQNGAARKSVRSEQDEKFASVKETDWCLPSTEAGSENGAKPKKRRKECAADGKAVEGSANYNNVLKEDKMKQNGGAGKSVRSEQDEKFASINIQLLEFGIVNGWVGVKLELSRQKLMGEFSEPLTSLTIPPRLITNNTSRVIWVSQGRGDAGAGAEQVAVNRREWSIDIDSNQVADGDQSVDKKTKKKKKKSKIQESEGNMNKDAPSLTTEEKNDSIMGFEDKNVEAKSSQVRTLSNGLVIEELEMGNPDGKIAALGKKASEYMLSIVSYFVWLRSKPVKVHYIGKLRENGQIFDTNIGKTPLKFRLGAEDVIEGWNMGLNGMRVGDKRRLTIPPLMGYGSQGAGENIPPNSWLVYEVELVGIR